MRHVLQHNKKEFTNSFIKKFKYAVQYNNNYNRISAIFDIEKHFSRVCKKADFFKGDKNKIYREYLIMNSVIFPYKIFNNKMNQHRVFNEDWGWYLYLTYEEFVQDNFAFLLNMNE